MTGQDLAERNAEILARYEAGEKVSHIARDIGLSGTMVARILSRNEGKRRSLTESEKAEIASRYKEDLSSLHDVAMLMNISTDRVRSVLDERGIEVRRGGHNEILIKNTVPLKKLEADIIAPGREKHLVPLLHFKGRMDLGRAHRMFNLAISMMHHDVQKIGGGVKLAHNNDYAQLCLPETRPDYIQVRSWLSRMRHKPEVTNLVPGLTEYVEWVLPSPFDLTPVSKYRQRRDRGAWWRTWKDRPQKIRAPRAPSVADLAYPYLIHEPKKEHELLTLVNNAVPKNLPEHVRADVCQDLLVAVLSGEIEKGEIEDNVKENVRKVFRMFPTKYGGISLDAPAPWSDDDRSLYETLGDESFW